MELFLIVFGIYACLVLLMVTLVFFVSQIMNDNSFIDVCYGPIFMIATWSTMLLTGSFGLLPLLASILVSLWALRLGIRIGRRHLHAPEDARYAVWRSKWMERGRAYFIVRSFIQVNLLQGVVISFVSLPIIISIFHNTAYSPLFLIVGLVVAALGLTLETLADYQLDGYIARKKLGVESSPIMDQGLFAHTRHPNYVGETLVWWGLALAVLTLPFGYLGLIGPILITFIITKVTGPMLETQMEERYGEDWDAYTARTPYFLPRFKRTVH